MISKVVHYCWFGQNPKPALIKQCMKSWHEKLPDWKFMEWNESNSPIEQPFVKKALRDKKFAFAADYVRLYALDLFGGVYLDTDLELVKGLNDLLSNECFFGYEEKNNCVIGCSVIGSRPKHPALASMLDHYTAEADYTPIPVIATALINDNIALKNTVTIYPYEYFYPYNPFDGLQPVKQLMFSNITSNTYAIHHWSFSWKPSISERIFTYIKRKIKR